MIDFLSSAHLLVGRCPICTNETLHTHKLPADVMLSMLGAQVTDTEELLIGTFQKPDPEPEEDKMEPLSPVRGVAVWLGGLYFLHVEHVKKMIGWSRYVRASVRLHQEEQRNA